MNELHIEVIQTKQELLALAPEWDALVERAGIDHPFLQHGWLRAWWESFGGHGELYVVLVRAGDRLIAAAPLMMVRVRMYGIPVRRLEFTANVHTPRFDFVIAEQHDAACALILDHLRRHAPRWDVLMLPELAESSRTLAALRALAASRALRSGVWSAGASPRIPIPDTFDAFWSRLSSKRRSSLRRRLQRLARLGPTSIEIVADPAELDGALSDGLRLEAAGWKGQAGTAIALHADLARFYVQVAEHAARSGSLRLLFLRVGDERVAFGYCLLHGRTLYLLKSGYDPDYAAYSPFNTLMLLAVEACAQEGLKAFDLLGSDDPWKRVWTDQVVGRRWLFLYRNTIRGLAVYCIKAWIAPWLKRVTGGGAPQLQQPATDTRDHGNALPKEVKAHP